MNESSKMCESGGKKAIINVQKKAAQVWEVTDLTETSINSMTMQKN